MTDNARLFDEYLKKNNFDLEFLNADGKTVLEIRQSLDGGIKARIVVIFDNDDRFIAIYGVDFLGGVNLSKRNQLLNLINELNRSYTYYKLVLENDTIQIQSFISVDNNFEPSILMDYILNMFDIIKEEYSNIMKVMWS